MRQNMTKINRLTIILAAVMIALSFQASAFSEDFIGSAQASTVNVCSCAAVENIITVTNTGSEGEVVSYVISDDGEVIDQTTSIAVISTIYKISVQGDAAQWTSFAPEIFSLKPGESMEVYEYISAPCGITGEFDLETRIKTESGIEKSISQTIRLNQCQNIELEPEIYQAQTCPCKPQTFQLNIKNTGTFNEIYTASVDAGMLQEYASLSESEFSIEAGDERTVYVYLNPTCDIYGDYELSFSALAERGQMLAQTTLTSNIQPCYEYTLQTGEYYNPSGYFGDAEGGDEDEDDSSDITTASITIQEGDYSICEKEYKVIPVVIENTAEIQNDYYLDYQGEDWTTFYFDYENNLFTLRGGDSAVIDVVLNPPERHEPGYYELFVAAVTERGTIAHNKTIGVDLQWCYPPAVDESSKKIKVNESGLYTPITILNEGEMTAEYVVDVYGAEWMSIVEGGITVEPGSTGVATLYTYPTNETEEGKYEITVNVKAENGVEYQDTIIVKYDKKGFIAKSWDWLKNIVSSYKWYILGGILGLILLIIILLYVKKQREKGAEKRKKKAEQKKEEKEAKKKAKKEAEKQAKKDAKKSAKKDAKKFPWLILAIIVVVLAVLGGSAYYYFSDSTAGNYTGNMTADLSVSDPFANVNESGVSDGEESKLWGMLLSAKNFIVTYLWYIVLAIVILIIIVLLPLIIRARKDKDYVELKKAQELLKKAEDARKEAERERKEAEKERNAAEKERIKAGKAAKIEKKAEKKTKKSAAKNRNYIVPLLIALIAIILLGGGYYYYTNYYVPQDPALNETGDVTVTNESADDTLSPFSGKEGECTFTLQAGTSKQIELTEAFSDPDEDRLIFTSTVPDDINVSFENGAVVLTPIEGFSGKRTIEFYADDGKGGKVSSGELTVCVEPAVQKSVLDVIKEGIAAYYNYIIAALVVLVLLILILKYSKTALDFLEEEDKGKKKRKKPKKK